jgi:predicted dienelactone hydrolase
MTYARSIVTLLIAIASYARADVRTTDETWQDAARDRDVPVRVYRDNATTKPAPIILLSHGLGGSRGAMAFAAEAWAAHGYVCVTLQHAGSDESLWRDAAPGRRLQALKSGMNAKAYLDRCGDVRFAINELARRNAADSDTLRGKLDLDRVGLAGHSFGAQTVQAIIGQRPPRANARLSVADPRVKAAVAFSPSYDGPNPQAAFAEVKTPCFHFTGTKDVAPVGGARVEDRRVPFDHIPPGEQFLVVLTDGDHAVFGGGEGRRVGADPKQYAAWHKLIVELTTKFWDAELRDDADAKRWLREDAKRSLGDAGTFEMRVAEAR